MINALFLGSFTVASAAMSVSTVVLLALPLSVAGNFRIISRIHEGVSAVASVSTAVTTTTGFFVRRISFFVPRSRSKLDGFILFSNARSSLLVALN